MATLWPLSHTVIFDLNGQIARGALVYFYDSGTTTPRTVYADSALTTPRTHPVVADAVGRFPAIFLPYGDYRARVTDASGVLIFDTDAISNPAPPDDGGGSGIVVSIEQIFQTGDALFLEKTGTRNGWVRDNGRTIGNAASGATERANADCANLFAWYWNNFSDSICPVSGGRGGSAAADFAANKTIQTLDKRGRAAVGLDDMGNSPANRIQRSTTINTTNGSTSVTVASVAGIVPGMYVISANIPAGATITAISGATLTLSQAATATASSTAARFSLFRDAQVPGYSAGGDTHALVLNEIPAHNHGGTTGHAGSHNHNYTGSTNNTVVGVGSGANPAGPVSTGNVTSTAPDHSHTIASAGGGHPHNNLQPSILGTWYRKL